MIKGSKAGLMGRHGLKMIQEGKAEIIFVTEGIPDMVALQSVVTSKTRLAFSFPVFCH